jgi:hypothetical protein
VKRKGEAGSWKKHYIPGASTQHSERLPALVLITV